MSMSRMHADEVDIDRALVAQLVATQFPQWADLTLAPVESAGTDNALFRLGDDMVVRLPRIPDAVAQVDKEHEWLPRLAPQLPLAIPVPLGKGAPTEGYPWPWSVYAWLEGENATVEHVAEPHQMALQLARFVAALQRIDASDGPPADKHNFFRGVPLAARDAPTRRALAELDGTIDTNAAAAAWDGGLEASPWQGPGVWLHGDLQSGNLLTSDGRISAVIDFGALGVGDPACDLMVAWNLLDADTRATFRASLDVDDATWARGRGWALSVGLIALPYYRTSNPVLAGISRRAISEVLADRENE
jgi:aminoglycoside phosphotransferase (APT) family kinase protein